MNPMKTTPRGRGATRGVVFAAALTALFAGAAFSLVDTPDASAEDHAATGSFAQGRMPAEEAADAGVVLGDTAVPAAPVAPPPPPPPPVYCPVPGAQFVDSWGFARSGGRRHEGVDMMAPYGTAVIAPVDGVVRASNSSLGGIGFYLDDTAGNEFFGSHLASLDVVGPVEAGQQIGIVGSTGNAGSPHLHFEIEPAGSSSVNPFPFVLDWCTTDYSVPGNEPVLP
jgi:murein DD-endopeptidase MepM/ murein hydrolase activator NlpD